MSCNHLNKFKLSLNDDLVTCKECGRLIPNSPIVLINTSNSDSICETRKVDKACIDASINEILEEDLKLLQEEATISVSANKLSCQKL